MHDDDLPELDLSPTPGCRVTTVTCSHLALESYEEVQERREQADGPLDDVKLTLYTEFPTEDPKKPKRVPYRATVCKGAIMEVHEVTPELWESSEEYRVTLQEQQARRPQIGFIGL